MKESPSIKQMEVVHQVAATYWQQPVDEVRDHLVSIEIIKFHGGKVSCILPPYQDYPSVFLKVYFYDRGYQFETAGLKAAAEMTPVEGVRVPKVLASYPDLRAVVLEHRLWQDTSSAWKRLWVNRLGIDWFKVGCWLRAFHDSQVSLKRNEVFLQHKFKKYESHLNTLKHLFTPDQVEKMNRVRQTARDYFDQHEVEWVISHGDFGLDNIKKSDSTLEIIDFEDCQPAPREFDFLNCFTRMDYLQALPRGRQHQQRMTADFLSGYGPMPPASPATDFLHLYIKLDMLETYYRRSNEDGYGWLQKIIFKNFCRGSLSRTRELLNSTKSITRINGFQWIFLRRRR